MKSLTILALRSGACMNKPINDDVATKKLQTKVDALEKQLKSFKTDGLKNVLTNLGVFGKGRTPSTSFAATTQLTANELNNIYRGDGFGKKIVNIYANEMTRQWISIVGDPSNNLQDYLTKLKAKTKINDAIKWARLYGGAIVFMMIDDGQEWSKPVNFRTIRSLEKLAVYDRTQTQITQYYADPSQPSLYNEPAIYTISQNIKATNTLTKSILDIHESRILRFDGEMLPNTLSSDNDGWGDSVLQPIYNQFINMLQAYDYGSEMLHDFIISVIKITGMANLLSSTGGDKKIQHRLDLTAQTRSINNIIVLDGADEYEKKPSSIGGLPELLDKFVGALSAVTGIPQIVLMGDTPSGLNSTGDNDVRNWYDSVKSQQEDILTDPINKLLTVIKSARDSRVKPDAKSAFVFNPLWQHSRQEIVAMQNQKAQTDQIYIQNGVYTPEAAHQHLIAGKVEYDPLILDQNKDPSFSDLNDGND